MYFWIEYQKNGNLCRKRFPLVYRRSLAKKNRVVTGNGFSIYKHRTTSRRLVTLRITDPDMDLALVAKTYAQVMGGKFIKYWIAES